MEQNHQLPVIISSAYLIADSKKKAFYSIFLVFSGDGYLVVKDSGIHNKVLDHRSWEIEDYESAKKFYDRKLREKLNPNRNSPRKYRPAEIMAA